MAKEISYNPQLERFLKSTKNFIEKENEEHLLESAQTLIYLLINNEFSKKEWKQIKKSGFHINNLDYKGNNLIAYAFDSYHISVLIDHNIDVNIVNNKGDFSLTSIKFFPLDSVKDLLEKSNINLEKRNGEGITMYECIYKKFTEELEENESLSLFLKENIEKSLSLLENTWLNINQKSLKKLKNRSL